MYKLKLKDGYKSKLSLRETQRAIKLISDTFQTELSAALNLERISAPLFVTKESGINDDLNGVERKVSFTAREAGVETEIVQSLAKWKRMALKRYGFSAGEGLYTNMNAIRMDDDMDNLHSVFVDQWDWEKIITREQRNEEFLKETVKSIVGAVARTQEAVKKAYPQITNTVCEDVFFITTQELEDMFPELSPEERENEIVKLHKTVFVMQIGGVLKSGIKHGGRAPDYDDWSLNGDIIFRDDAIDGAIEISSMGIRVDEKSLIEQLKLCNNEDRLGFDYHRQIANGELPLTIGGGIGQSRLCMFLLEKLHIGEVQSSIWPAEMYKTCAENGIVIL
ncbi:MAG: aspartate--ammonia ligase [Oscillospiraceae bacterium]